MVQAVTMDHGLNLYVSFLKDAKKCKTNDELRTWLLTIIDEKYVKLIMAEMPDISTLPFLTTKTTSDTPEWIYGWSDSLHDRFASDVPSFYRHKNWGFF